MMEDDMKIQEHLRKITMGDNVSGELVFDRATGKLKVQERPRARPDHAVTEDDMKIQEHLRKITMGDNVSGELVFDPATGKLKVQERPGAGCLKPV